MGGGGGVADIGETFHHAALPCGSSDYYKPDLPPGTVFYPAAHGTLSGCGPGAEALQRRLAHLVAEIFLLKANGGTPPSARLIGLKAQDLRERRWSARR